MAARRPQPARKPGRIVLGSRTSALARAQTTLVEDALAGLEPELAVAFTGVTSLGDRRQDADIAALGGVGVFTQELEAALREGRIDGAVHSLKDLPTEVPDDLPVVACLPREEPRDAALTADGRPLESLAPGARVGTSSWRRRAFLERAHPRLRVVPMRGNLDTRLGKLDRGEVEAIVVAAAGLLRLGVERPFQLLDPDEMPPAPGQGAVAVQARRRGPWAALLGRLDDPQTRLAASAERAFLAAFGGGCQMPLGALARHVGDALVLEGAIVSRSGEVFRGRVEGPGDAGEALGERLARELRGRGAEPPGPDGS